jgi:hypothetical protein
MEQPSELQKPPMANPKRILAVDIIRGFSIFGVLFIHPMIYGTWMTETLALQVVPEWVLALFTPIIIMGTWGGGFPMISSLVITYNTFNRLEKGYSFRSATNPVLINSTLLFFLDPLRHVLFGRTWTNAFSEGYNYTIMSRLFETGQLGWPDPEAVFQIGSLPAIGLSGYAAVILLRFLFNKGPRQHPQKSIFIPLALGVAFSLVSTPLNHMLAGYVPELYLQGGIYRFLAYLMRFFVGAQLSFFPVGCYAFFGVAFGYLLATRVEFKKIRRVGLSLGFGYLLAFGGILTIKILRNPGNVIGVIFGILDYEIYPVELLFISLGCMCLIFVGLVKRFEYITPEVKAKRIKKSKFWRRFGVATLSLYFMEPFINNLFAYLFHWIFGTFPWTFGQEDAFMTNVPAIFLYVATFETFWILFVWFWEKHDFKYGFEYWIAKAGKKRRKVPSLRLSLNDMSQYYPPKHATPEKGKKITDVQ